MSDEDRDAVRECEARLFDIAVELRRAGRWDELAQLGVPTFHFTPDDPSALVGVES